MTFIVNILPGRVFGKFHPLPDDHILWTALKKKKRRRVMACKAKLLTVFLWPFFLRGSLRAQEMQACGEEVGEGKAQAPRERGCHLGYSSSWPPGLKHSTTEPGRRAQIQCLTEQLSTTESWHWCRTTDGKAWVIPNSNIKGPRLGIIFLILFLKKY